MSLKEAQRSAISEAQAIRNATRRPTVQALEEVLLEPTAVLDHGFVQAIDHARALHALAPGRREDARTLAALLQFRR